MPPVGFEPMIAAGERPKTYALGRADIGTGNSHSLELQNSAPHKTLNLLIIM